MPEQVSQFPDSLTLNGADYFLLQLDKLMWRSSGKRNVSTFVVSLPERLPLNELHNHLANRPAYQWLCRLRLREGLPFCLAKWKLDARAELPIIAEYTLAKDGSLPDRVLSANLDICRGSAFKIDLLHQAGAGSIVVFTWHHALMDAHGGELFVRYLGAVNLMKRPIWVADEASKLPLKIRAQIASEMKEFLYNAAQLPLLSLFKGTVPKPLARYRVLAFTPQQSVAINNRAGQLNAGFLVSAFYLAATTNAVAQVQKQRDTDTGDILVPIPLDCRKRGAQDPVLGNQVSFLFYRIPNAVIGDVSACTNALIEQMKSLMRAESPSHYTIMLDFLRRMPGFIYRQMLKSPTEGLMASFFYSDTGDSLQDFDALFGQQVLGAIHYPPNMYPPGMTFIFSRFHGALQITLGYMEQDVNTAEVDLLLKSLCSTLLGDEGG
ncbi:putative polyketide synthase component [Methyloglobulus morosus KoM1]|uniref:Putative polyketide synthase component n=1 Tax=Methyloglobulus morosus KoM1 TaxID=1116472 RepID=V5BJI2_9GAMM|nr:hypothetical protein [Methyloglobulus morosus]ESS73470.1 putative polyketide synthase component [Methyloglobulus morosus KoM1]